MCNIQALLRGLEIQYGPHLELMDYCFSLLWKYYWPFTLPTHVDFVSAIPRREFRTQIENAF